VIRDISIHTSSEFNHTIDGSNENHTTGNVQANQQAHPIRVQRSLSISGDTDGGIVTVGKVATFSVETETDDREKSESKQLDSETNKNNSFTPIERTRCLSRTDLHGSDTLHNESKDIKADKDQS